MSGDWLLPCPTPCEWGPWVSVSLTGSQDEHVCGIKAALVTSSAWEEMATWAWFGAIPWWWPLMGENLGNEALCGAPPTPLWRRQILHSSVWMHIIKYSLLLWFHSFSGYPSIHPFRFREIRRWHHGGEALHYVYGWGRMETIGWLLATAGVEVGSKWGHLKLDLKVTASKYFSLIN